MTRIVFRRLHVQVLSIWLVLLLTACGGATGSSSEPVATLATTPPPTTGSDSTPPIVSITAPKAGATVSGTVIVSATASDPTVTGQTTSGIAGVQFKLDGISLGSEDTVSPYSVSGNTTSVGNGAHVITAVARDVAGNTTTSAAITVTVSNPVPIPTPDSTPPSVPGGIKATAISSSQIDVSWNASTDNVGVTGYKVFRNGSNVAIVIGTYFQDNGLAALTSYTYTVLAYDAVGNNSTVSSGASATTLASGAQSGLGALAASMQPGTWAVLNTDGDGSGWGAALLDAGNNQHILQYSDKAKWDSNLRRLLFIGKGHLANQKFISYTEASNKWKEEPQPFWNPGGYGHGYNHNSMDAEGNHYYHLFDSTAYYKYTRTTGTWAQLPDGPQTSIAAGVEYFPEMGGLIVAGPYGGIGTVNFYNSTTGKWSQLAAGLTMGPYHNVAVYNPIHKIVLFGGGNGSSDLYKIDATGKISKIQNAPVNVGIAASVFTIDPTSGKYLLFGEGGGFYQYDVPTNTWNQLNASQVPIFPPTGNNFENIYGCVAAPVSTYGVVLFLEYSGDQSKVYVYKHL